MGIDLGNTQVSLIAESLDGSVIAEINEDIPGREAFDMSAVTKSASRIAEKSLRQLSKLHGPMRAIAIGVPVIVSDNHPQLSSNAWLADLRKTFSFGGVSPLIENNVNCATVAEMRRGAAQGRRSFAYLQVGVKIGLSVVHNGALYRGANGAAGEVARIPYPWTPTGQSVRGALDERLGSAALLERVTKEWTKSGGPRPDSVRALFAAAESGNAAARGMVEAYGLEIGRLAAAIIGVMDPGLIVMGGGVGQKASAPNVSIYKSASLESSVSLGAFKRWASF
ncbi:ROK family protein [Acidisoma cellulosilytica]|uniref:ROK family protein n=1 Tax=Acidisoma cellulosilyticum TaxID=2802395 RepID=A0A964E6U6_9PROT|nr:ROK family protein [Acidisoma cellulosilyticum]MCB8883832.1 ROK family protein [Acidisoma cellulosilyticum]